MGKKAERLENFEKTLKQKQYMKLADIVHEFNVSEATARRMCTELEKEGSAIRTFGGIKYLQNQGIPLYSFDTLSKESTEEKKRIGTFAATLVEDNDTIFLSGGTTVFAMAVELANIMQSKKFRGLNIMTNSIVAAEILSPYTPVILTGGEYRPERRDTAGIIGEKAVNNARFSKCFIGVDAIDMKAGLMTWDVETARLDQATLRHSSSVYLLIDSSKFGKRTSINYEEVSPNYSIITDNKIDPEIIDIARSTNMQIVVV